jgi:hypothetical protein
MRVPIAVLTILLLLAPSALASATPDLVLPAEQYSSAKARQLATTHASTLRDLGTTLYHCLPWLEVQRHSVGFFKPRHASTDERYLAVRVFVEQDASPAFASLNADQRASAMFSRYVGHLLRRMAQSRALLSDADVAGFTVIVEWLKQGSTVNGRPVHETIAVFLDKRVASEYLSGRIGGPDLGRRARVLAFDGETPLGPLALAAWDDDFASTYQVKGYEMPNGVDCRLR